MSDGVEWLFQGRNIRAYVRRGVREGTVASFSHWEAGRHGEFGAPGGTSWVHERGFTLLRIETCRNDWYQNEDLSPAQDALAERAHTLGPVRLYGNSMGAAGALMFGAALQAVSGCLISPRFTKGMASSSLFAQAFGPQYTVLYDPTIPIDVWGARRIAAILPDTRLVPLAGGGHPATGVIHRGGRYSEVRRYVVGEYADPAHLERLHDRLCRRNARAAESLPLAA